MTKNIDWGFLAFATVLAIFVGVLALGALVSDSSEWTPITEDCVLNVETDRRLSGSTEARQIYCATEEVR